MTPAAHSKLLATKAEVTKVLDDKKGGGLASPAERLRAKIFVIYY